MPTWLAICPRSDINWERTKEKHKGITRTTRKGIIREIADFVTQFGDNIVSIPEDFLPLRAIILVLALESFWLSRISFKVIPDQGAMSISIDFLSLQFCEISEQRIMVDDWKSFGKTKVHELSRQFHPSYRFFLTNIRPWHYVFNLVYIEKSEKKKFSAIIHHG